MKKLFSVLIIGVILLFSGCRKETEQEVNPPFFHVVDAQTGGEVYLLGTMHVAEKNCALPEAVYQALDGCGRLAVEVDLIALDADSKRMSEAMKLMEIKDGTAADFIGDSYTVIQEYFKKERLYNSTYDRYIPAVWSSTLTTQTAKDCGYYSKYGTERLLLSYAKKNGVEIVELESAEQQYQINANEPRELQNYLLLSSVLTDPSIRMDQTRELYRAWSESDHEALEQMISEDSAPAGLEEEYAQYYSEMYTNRQSAMAEYIINVLESGEKAFVAVGAMHFYAAPDILDFLEDAGYSLEVRS